MLQQKVLSTIQTYKLIRPKDTIVIGVSGGPDSMCLLDILWQLQQKLEVNIIVAHVNHKIRKEADSETDYVKHYCKEHNIPCYVKKVDVKALAKENKLGTEEMGRTIRYQFFEEVAQKEKANKIATAHNSNDNAETVLMNILRGTSTSGLKGIEMIRQNKYIRPLRECTRKEIEQYCQLHNLNPKIDQSNFENIYTRNKIRNELLPLLQQQFNPNVIETINRLSELAAEEDAYFSQVVQQEYERIKREETKEEIVFCLEEFNKLPKVIKSRLILYTINKLIGSTQGTQKIHIEDILTLCEKNIGNKYLMPNKNIKILVSKGKVFYQVISNFP